MFGIDPPTVSWRPEDSGFDLFGIDTSAVSRRPEDFGFDLSGFGSSTFSRRPPQDRLKVEDQKFSGFDSATVS